MAIIDDVKCPRCDRKYSGVRSRCPYCGARRIGLGKYSKTGENAKGKMLISVLILAVFTVAAGILLFSTDPVEAQTDVSPSPLLPPEDMINSMDGIGTPTPSPTPENTPPPPPKEVETIAVKHTNGSALAFHNDISLPPNSSYDLAVYLDPPGVEVEPRIASDNEEVFTVDWVPFGVKNGFRITTLSAGVANLIVSAGEKDITVIVRVK